MDRVEGQVTTGSLYDRPGSRQRGRITPDTGPCVAKRLGVDDLVFHLWGVRRREDSGTPVPSVEDTPRRKTAGTESALHGEV